MRDDDKKPGDKGLDDIFGDDPFGGGEKGLGDLFDGLDLPSGAEGERPVDLRGGASEEPAKKVAVDDLFTSDLFSEDPFTKDPFASPGSDLFGGDIFGVTKPVAPPPQAVPEPAASPQAEPEALSPADLFKDMLGAREEPSEEALDSPSEPSGLSRLPHLQQGLPKDKEGRPREAELTLRAAGRGPVEELPPEPALDGDSAEWWADEVDILGAELKQAGAVASVPLLFEMGRVYAERLNDDAQALDAFHKAFKRNAKFKPVYPNLDRLYRRTGDYTQLLFLLDSQIKTADDPMTKTALLRERGRIYELHVGNEDQAKKAFLQVLDHSPDDPVAVQALETLCQRTNDMDTLSSVYRKLTHSSQTASRRSRYHRLQARLARASQQNRQAAVKSLTACIEEDPKDLQALNDLIHHHWEERNWERAIETMIKVAEALGSCEEAALLLRKAARLASVRLFQDEMSLELLNRALAMAPDNLLVLREAARAAERLTRWEDLDRLQAREAELTHDPARLTTLLYRMGVNARDRLQDDERAMAAFKRTLETSPRYLPALQSLGDLYTKQERWDDLVAMHLVEAGVSQNSREKALLLTNAAELLEMQLGQDDRAIEQYRAALACLPGDSGILQALARLLTKGQRFQELVDLYEQEIPALGDAPEATILLEEVSRLWEEELSDPVRATERYRALYDRDPTHLPALQALKRAYERTGRWDELVQLLKDEGEITTDPDRLVAIYSRCGSLCEEELGEVDRARDYYEQAQALQPDYLPALKALQRLYIQGGHWDRLISLYEQILESTTDTHGRLEALFKIAMIRWIRQDDPVRAAEHLERILALAPGFRPALRALARLHESREDWHALVEILLQEVEVITDSQARAMMLYRIGSIMEHKLTNREGAVTFYRRAVEAGGLRPALRSLARIYEAQGEWSSLADIYRDQLKAQGDAPEPGLLERLGHLSLSRLGDRDEAMDLFTRLTERRENLVSLKALERVSLERGDREALPGLYRRMAGQVSDPKTKAAFLMRGLSLHEALGQVEEAASLGREVLELEPDNLQALRFMANHCEAAGDRALLGSILTRLLDLQVDVQARVILRMKLGKLAQAEGNLDQAIEHFRAVSSLMPEHLPAIKALKGLYGQKEEWERLVAVLELEGRETRNPAQRVDSFLEAGQLYQERLERLDEAVANLYRVLEVDPVSREAFDRLSSILEAKEDWVRLAELLRNRIQLIKQPGERMELLMRLGPVYADHLRQRDNAKNAYITVIKLNPSHCQAYRDLFWLFHQDRQWREAAQSHARLIQLNDDPLAVKPIHMAVAPIYEREFHDVARATASLKRALAVDPSDREALRTLCQILVRAKEWRGAKEVAERLEGLEEEQASRVEVLLWLADIHQTGLSDLAGATAHVVKALTLEPTNPQALTRLSDLAKRTGNMVLSKDHLDKAAQSHRDKLQTNPLDLEAYQALRFVLNLQGEMDQLLVVSSIIKYFKLEDEEAMRFLQENRSIELLEPQRPLEAEAFEQRVMHPDDRTQGAAILRFLDGSLPSMYPQELASYGVGRSDKVTPKDICPEQKTITQLAGLTGLSLESFDLYRSQLQRMALGLVNVPRPAVIIGVDLLRKITSAEERFLIGRLLARIMGRQVTTHRVPPSELTVLVSAVGCLANPTFIPTGVPQDSIDAMQSKVLKAVSRKDRKVLETMAQELVRSGEARDMLRLAMGLRHSANRLGLVLANDIGIAIECLKGDDDNLRGRILTSPEQAAEVLATSAQIPELLRFALSEDYLELRRTIGVAMAR